MALGWRTLHAIPRLLDYDSANRREMETKPIRGDSDNLKPLGQRSQKWLNIKREDNNDIVIYYSQNPCVRYRPNGDVLLYDHGYWNKAGNNEIIGEITGIHLQTHMNKAWFEMQGRTHYLRPSPRTKWVNGTWQQSPEDAQVENIFRLNERGHWTYVNPPMLTKHVVNRAGAKAVRARYAEALGYIEALTKLRRDEPPKWDEIAAAFPDKMEGIDPQYSWQRRAALPPVVYKHQFEHEHAAQITQLMASSDPGDHYKAYLWLHREAVVSQVMGAAQKVLIMHHYDEWLDKREVVPTNKSHDQYVWAIPPQE